MVKIKNRLNSLVKYVNIADKVMDVGCDHALLDIYLVQEGIQDKVYVCDVNPNALENGKKNIEENDMVGKVIPILGFGIEKTASLDIDTLIISGMGSNSIIEIISSPLLSKIYKLVLQSNTNHYDLRKYLTKLGFNIFDEEIIRDGKKEYVNIVAVRDYVIKTYSEKEYLFGPVLIKNKKNLEYFEKLKSEYEDLYYRNRNEKHEEGLKYLEEIVNDLKSS